MGLYSIVIALLKVNLQGIVLSTSDLHYQDTPDVIGDSKSDIQTLSVRIGVKYMPFYILTARYECSVGKIRATDLHAIALRRLFEVN